MILCLPLFCPLGNLRFFKGNYEFIKREKIHLEKNKIKSQHQTALIYISDDWSWVCWWCARLLWCLRCDSVLSAQQQAASDAQKAPAQLDSLQSLSETLQRLTEFSLDLRTPPKTSCRRRRTRKLIELLSRVWDHSQRKWLISCFISTSALYKYYDVYLKESALNKKIWWRKCVRTSLDDAFTCTLTKKETAKWE